MIICLKRFKKGDEVRISNDLRKKLFLCIIVYAILIVFLTLFHIPFSFYYLTCTAIVLFVCNMEHEFRKENMKKETQMKELDWLLSTLRHSYYAHGMVDEAMLEAMEQCKNKALKHQIKQMHMVLTSTDPKIQQHKFEKENPNRYYKMLLTLCLTVMEFGDKTMQGQSLFLSNLKVLRIELHTELRNHKILKHHFTGLVFVILLPLLSVKWIEAWGMKNLEELVMYYRGTYQVLFYLLIFFLTIGLYYLFYLFKSPIKVIASKHNFLTKISKTYIFNRISLNYKQLFPIKIHRHEILIMEVGETMDGTMLFSLQVVIGIVSTLFFFIVFGSLYSYFLAWVWILSILLAYLAAKIPILLLYYRKKCMQMFMEEEVFQYYSILSMLMYMDRISTYELLEAMENFSVIFREQLRCCLTEYESGQQKALYHLKGKVRCEAMEKLVDQLLMCDEIGVEKALDELTLEMTFYNEQRKQQTEINLEKKGVLCKFLAFIPLTVTIGIYLIYPFISVSLQKLMGISAELTGK